MLRHPLLTIALLAFIARLGAVLISTSLPRGTFALDDSTYTGMAASKASGDITHWDESTIDLWNRTSTFTTPIQWLFTVLGPKMWVAQLYVALWGIVACVLITAIALLVLPRTYALGVGICVAVLPSQVIWSSLALKDAAVWATLAALGLIMLHAAQASGRQLAMLGAGAALVLLLMAHLREHTLLVAGWALVGAAFFGRKDTRTPRLAGALLLAIVMPWLHSWGPGGEALIRDPNLASRRAANAVGAQSAFVDPDTNGDEPGGPFAGEEDGGPGDDEGGSGGPGDEGPSDEEPNEEPEPSPGEPVTAPPDSITANLRHLPRGLSVMLFEPVPWRATTSANMAMARWETILWYPLMLLAFIGLVGARRRLEPLAFALLAGGGMLLVYALAEGNIGTAYRHRGEFVWVVALLAGFGLQRIITNRSSRA